MSAWDLIVVGGGPAGSTLAGLARKYHPGRRVLVLEKARFPRHHVGESLLPGMIPVLKELGVFDTLNAAGFPRKIGAAFVWGKDRAPWDADFNNLNLEMIERYGRALDTEFSWQVVRSRYDEILLRHAEGLGAEVRHGWRAVAPIEEGGRVVGVLAEDPEGQRHELRADLTADCSGQNSFLGPHRGTRAYNEDLKNVAAYAYFRGARWKFEYQGHPDKTKIFICSAPEGWFWYIPVEKDLVSVGLVSKAAQVKAPGADLRERFFKAVKACPEIAPLLEGARLETGMDPADPARDFFAAGDWSFTSERACGPGWLAAGDAAFFLDPLLSSGVMMAHLSGHKAAYAVGTAWAESDPAVRSALWDDYDRFCREIAGAFGALVLYWYRHDPCTESWWKLARETMAAGTGLDLEDRLAFTTIAAGLHYYFERAYTTQSLLFAPIGKQHAWQWEGSKHDLKRWSRQVLAVVETGFLAPDADKDPAVKEAVTLTALEELPDAWVPAWTCQRRLSTAFLPEPGTGRLRPIRRMDYERPGKPTARRLLPRAYLDALDLVDGRRSVGEIRAALLERSPLPADLVAGQLFRILKDLAVLGALSFDKDAAAGAAQAREQTHLRLGERALQAGDPEAAARELDAAIAAGAAPAWAFALRGEARRHLGRPQDAEDDLREALRLTAAPAAPGADRLETAVAAFEADIRRGWLEDRIHIYRGKLRLERGDAAGARADAETALRANPKHSEALLLRAKAARLLGEPDAARSDLLAALAVENAGRKGEG